MVYATADGSARERLRVGMVGGGRNAFIGAVHRLAMRLDDQIALVAGALSSDPANAAASAAEIGLPPDRSYSDYHEMAKVEAARPDGIEAVVIVTPNHLHAPVATAFLEAGIDVICDKPLSTTLADEPSAKSKIFIAINADGMKVTGAADERKDEILIVCEQCVLSSKDGHAVWQGLLDRSVLVRDCSSWPRLEGCLRVTIGTPDEDDLFLAALEEVL